MRINAKNGAWLLIVVGLGGLGSAGCQQAATEARLNDLAAQMAEMNRRLTDTQVRLEDAQSRLLVLEDRVADGKVSGARVAPPVDLKVVKLVPNGAGEKQAAPLTFPAASATNEGGNSSVPCHTRVQQAAEEAQNGHFEQALAVVSPLLATCPEGADREAARYWKGAALAELGRASSAVEALEPLSSQAGFPHAAGVLYYLGVCWHALNEHAKAEMAWQALQTQFPTSPEWSRAQAAAHHEGAHD